MQPTTNRSSVSVAESEPTAPGTLTSAVPWDAPNFGAPVYFTYSPSQAGGRPATATVQPSAGMRPAWTHFPYFGGAIYDRFPSYPAELPALSTQPTILPTTGPQLDALQPRFFGSRIYLAYEPARPNSASSSSGAGTPPTVDQGKREQSAPMPTATARSPQLAATAKPRGWWSRLFGIGR
jgi:hypothetical protein